MYYNLKIAELIELLLLCFSNYEFIVLINMSQKFN